MKVRGVEVRLIPVIVFASGALFVLKAAALIGGDGYVLPGPRAVQAEPAMPAPPLPKVISLFEDGDITGTTKKPEQGAAAPADAAAAPGSTEPVLSETRPVDVSQPMSPAEKAILERLQDRRQELEAQRRELEIRNGMLKAAEKRLEGRVNELKEIETRLAKAAAEREKREEAEVARYKGLVTMYENMKAKDAAKIFDRLDLKVLVEVATQINPRRMADIMGQMTPEAAEKLTIELAKRSDGADKPQQTAAELPKIEGRPSVQ
jgi:flagellar motility protein MotE (MotC chaperone)